MLNQISSNIVIETRKVKVLENLNKANKLKSHKNQRKVHKDSLLN